MGRFFDQDKPRVLAPVARDRFGRGRCLCMHKLLKKNLTGTGFFIISCHTLGGYGYIKLCNNFYKLWH
jgi:hypothetical protein